jgi:hypothetical protein
MEENEIEIESVIIETNTDSSTPISEGITNSCEEKAEKLVRFPLTRIKHLVKMDPDVNLCSNEALFLLTKATVKKLLDCKVIVHHTIYCNVVMRIILLCSPFHRNSLLNVSPKKHTLILLSQKRRQSRNEMWNRVWKQLIALLFWRVY